MEKQTESRWAKQRDCATELACSLVGSKAAFKGSGELCWLDTCSRAEVGPEGVALGARRAGEARQWSRQVLGGSGREGRWYSKHMEQRVGP